MAIEGNSQSYQLDQYRDYLRLLARVNLDSRLQGKCDVSDLVQDVLLRAHQSLATFRGRTEVELKAWLRQVLTNTMINTMHAYRTQKRNAGAERSLEVALDDTSSRLDDWLLAEQSSPSDQAMWNERVGQLAAALAQLPDGQRHVVELRHLQGFSIDDICRTTAKTEAAVAGLLRRGLKSLRDLMHE